MIAIQPEGENLRWFQPEDIRRLIVVETPDGKPAKTIVIIWEPNGGVSKFTTQRLATRIAQDIRNATCCRAGHEPDPTPPSS